MGEKISRGLVVFDRGGMKSQAAGILVEAEHHHGSFIFSQFNALFHEEMSEYRNRRTDRLDMLGRPFQAPRF